MGRTRRGFTPEYKDEAVKLVINTGRTVATVARELGLNEAGAQALPGQSHRTADERPGLADAGRSSTITAGEPSQHG